MPPPGSDVLCRVWCKALTSGFSPEGGEAFTAVASHIIPSPVEAPIPGYGSAQGVTLCRARHIVKCVEGLEKG